MRGLILAAGYGRRMQPLSGATHKALLPIGGTTILSRLVEGLCGIGIESITVVTGHQADAVRAHLSTSFPGVAFDFVHNADFAETNNIVSLALAMEALEGDDDVVLTECDLLLEPAALSPLLDGGGNVALVDRYRPGMDGTVVTEAGGYVTDVITPARQGPGFDFDGKLKTLNVYRFEADFCRRTLRPLLRWYAEEVDRSSYYEAVLGMLVGDERQRIAARLVPPGSWVEVDDPNDLAAARFRFEPESRPALLDRAFGGHWAFDVTDFSFMRNEYFPTDAMLAAMRHALPELVASYGSAQEVLDQKLAWFVGCDPARLVALNGASQAFPILRRVLESRRVAIPTPTFGEYARTLPDATTYPDALVAETDLDAVAAGHDVVVAVSPNNPTGTTIPAGRLHSLAGAHPDTLLVVDESFGGFSGEPSLVRALEAEPLPNALVLVSLSKSLGVPGLRLGYLYSTDPGLLEPIRAELPVWNMGALAEFFAELLLKFRPELEASLERTRADRDLLRDALAGLDGVEEVHAGGGNFVLVRLAGDADRAAAVRRGLLVTDSIEVKDVSAKFADGRAWLRIAVRTPDHTARLANALERELGAP